MDKTLEIYGKASLDYLQIEDKIKKGCKQLELHLGREWCINGVPQSIDNVCPDWKNLVEMIDIKVVHIPMVQENIEFLLDKVKIKLLNETFKLANTIGEIYNHKVLVVVHTESNYELLEEVENLLPYIKKKVLSLLDMYPNVELGIENVSPIQVVRGDLRLRGGIIDDNIRLVEYINSDRVGTVFDVCHAKITEMYLKSLNVYNIFENYDLRKLMKLNKDYVKLIHLATFEGSGYGKGHGIGFTDKSEMMEFVKLYKELGLNCPITLEVAEVDYLESKSYVLTRKLLEECWNEI